MKRPLFEDINKNIRFNDSEGADVAAADRDPYIEVRYFVDQYNEWRKTLVDPGPYLTMDECMSFWDGVEFRYSIKGIPNFSILPRKPKARGTELKAACDGETNIMLFIEIQEGKDRMKKKKPVEWITNYGQTVVTSMRLVQNWKHTGRTAVGDAWFGSFKDSTVGMHSNLGFFSLMIIKTAHTEFPLQWFKNWGSTITRENRGQHKILHSTHQLRKLGIPEPPADAQKYDIYALGWADKKTQTIIFNHGTTEPAGELERKRIKVSIHNT